MSIWDICVTNDYSEMIHKEMVELVLNYYVRMWYVRMCTAKTSFGTPMSVYHSVFCVGRTQWVVLGAAATQNRMTVARPQRIWKYNIIYGRGRDRSGTQKAKLHVNT